MLAVNRSYGKSDYIPCITWGRTARYAANLKIGDKVQLVGFGTFEVRAREARTGRNPRTKETITNPE